jgi:hypothetical protein
MFTVYSSLPKVWYLFTRVYGDNNIILWHVDPLLGNGYEISSYTTAVANQWLSSDYVGSPTDANATIDTATDNDVFCAVRAETL